MEEDDALAETNAIVYVLGDFLINNMMSVIESQKVFFADPAFFKKNPESEFDVADDMYKRFFGLGSTGARFAISTESAPENTFNVSTITTQKFKSIYYKTILNKQI